MTTAVDSATGACILGLSIALASLLAVLGAIITSTALLLSHCFIVSLRSTSNENRRLSQVSVCLTAALQFAIARCEVLVDRRRDISSNIYWSELGKHESFAVRDLCQGTTAGALIVTTALCIISASLCLSIALCRTFGCRFVLRHGTGQNAASAGCT